MLKIIYSSFKCVQNALGTERSEKGLVLPQVIVESFHRDGDI